MVYDPRTQLTHDGDDRDRRYGAAVPPLYQNSTFTFEDWDALDDAFEDRTGTPIYSRQINPTVRTAERHLADLAGAEAARLCSSGMAAITAAVLHFLKAGDHIVTIHNVYGPAATLMNRYLPEKCGIDTTFVAGHDHLDFERAVTERTRLFYLESPSSALFGLQDIAAVCEIAKPRGIRVVTDNTWATPLYQRTLDLGADLEVHSVSKYLGGHSDMVAGLVLGDKAVIDRLAVAEGELLGGMMAPFEAWMLLRSLRTFPARLREHERSALVVARALEEDPRIRRVLHPGLESHPQYDLATRQMTGTTGLFGFTLESEDLAAIKRFFNAVELFGRGVSWGGHESLIYAPAISYLKEQPPERFAELGLAPGDMRVSIGLESPDDLIADLGQALDRM